MRRKFAEEGDIEHAYDLMAQCGALARTEQLAEHHANLALESIGRLQASQGQESLVALVHQVLKREK